jgi:diguanylate cyclase (GGDEF)-like protein
MIKVSPGSELSIKKAVNLYTFIVLIGFALLLSWLGMERYQYHVDANTKVAENATTVAAAEVKSLIENKRRIVNIFTEDFGNLIGELAREPDNEALHNTLNSRIKKYLPDFFASNIMTPIGKPVIGDFDGYIGDLCITDLRNFLETEIPSIRVHPNLASYHYDVVSKFRLDSVNHIFFVSFDLSEIGDVLHAVQPSGHRLMLIHKNAQDLIEVTAEGGRENLVGRLDYRLNGNEKMRILSTVKVNGTQWHVIDMYEEALFSDYRDFLIKEYLTVYFIFTILALYMRSILVAQDTKRTIAETNLLHSNDNIRKLNNKLEALSRTDGLTGLYNRRYFDERMTKEWNRSMRSGNALSCILVDIDYFKQYNDCYGHLIGDECLRVVAALLLDVFRRAGDLVARYGGEEFIVIMPSSTVEDAEKAVLQLQKALEKEKIAHKRSRVSDYLTVSAGLVNAVPVQGDTIASFISKADRALYQAKAAGRNRLIVYVPDSDDQAQHL